MRVDRVVAVHVGSRGFDSHRRHMSDQFFRSSRPGYPHPVCSELENSCIRVAVGDFSVTMRRRWRPPYQNGQNWTCARKHTTNMTRTNARRRVCATAEPLGERRYENWITHRTMQLSSEEDLPQVMISTYQQNLIKRKGRS